jgi:outer membrane protein OmpA-like peptidoglycan-associated protein
MYFSSEGHMGYGGLDIYHAEANSEGWNAPVNMMKKVNSSYDDFGIALNHDLQTGLFSSNRPEGFGSDDIYAFELGRKLLTICGKVVDPDNNPLPGATVFFLNKTKNEVLILKSDSTGTYCTEVDPNTNYTILGKKTSHIDDCLDHKILAEAVNPDDLVLMPYKVDQVFKIENIYYDLDKWYIRPDAEPPLDKLVRVMQEHPITIELSSHTDCRASDEYNIDLSQKRAESAVRYLVLNGISSARMTARGYGETMLVNECADGVECTEEEHQMNRRTEFKVTSVGKYGSGWSIEETYREGDIIPLSKFDRNFFNPCLEVK